MTAWHNTSCESNAYIILNFVPCVARDEAEPSAAVVAVKRRLVRGIAELVAPQRLRHNVIVHSQRGESTRSVASCVTESLISPPQPHHMTNVPIPIRRMQPEQLGRQKLVTSRVVAARSYRRLVYVDVHTFS